ncbi:TonB-dependent receptor [Fulvivirga imtechensis]|nr:TonB-dependent receptor [Fulvivirga imtechensis]
MKQLIKISLLLTLVTSFGKAPGQSIRGRVLDGTNFQPLAHASIFNLQDSTGTTSDEKGYFSLETFLPVLLQVSHVGYDPQHVRVSANDEMVIITLQAQETNLLEVIVRASHIKERYLDAPATINLISRKQLERNDEMIVTPALNRIPGIYMHSGSLNTNRITIRGVGARTPYDTDKIKAYFDDIPLTSGEGTTALEDIDLSAIQRIEVIKGPGSSVYGAGLGGVINLHSRTATTGENVAHAKSTAGSYGLRRNVLQYLAGKGNKQLAVSYANVHSDGFRENNAYDRQSVVITGHFFPNDRSKFSLLGLYTNLKAYIPSSINYETYKSSPEKAAFTWKQARGYEAYDKASAGFSYEYDLARNIKHISSTFVSFRYADEPRPFDILKENTIGIGFRSRLVAEKEFFNIYSSFSLGMEYFNDWHQWATYQNLYEQFPGQGSIAGGILSDNEEARQYYNLFAQANLQFTPKLAAQFGLNFNNTSYTLTDLYPADSIDQSGNYTFDHTWSPRMALSYKITQNNVLFASVSHGFSPPSLAETLTPEGRINPDIQPEAGWSYEVGSKSSWLNGRLHTEVSIYRMEIEDLLVAERVGPDTYVGVNAGRTIHNGLEAMVNFEIADGVRWSVKPYLAATFMDYKFDVFVHEDQDYSGNELTGVPQQTLNFGLDMSLAKGFYLYFDYSYVGKIPLNDQNSAFSESYNILHGKAGYQTAIGQHFNVDVSFGVNNITDENYAAMVLVNAVGFGGSAPRYYYPGLPRNYYGSVLVSYKL